MHNAYQEINSILLKVIAIPYVDNIERKKDEYHIAIRFKEDEDQYISLHLFESKAEIIKKVDLSKYGPIIFKVGKDIAKESYDEYKDIMKLLFTLLRREPLNLDYIKDFILRYLWDSKYMIEDPYERHWEYDPSIFKFVQELNEFKQEIENSGLLNSLEHRKVIVKDEMLILQLCGHDLFYEIKLENGEKLEDEVTFTCLPIEYYLLFGGRFFKCSDACIKDRFLLFPEEISDYKLQTFSRCELKLTNKFYKVSSSVSLDVKLIMELFPSAGSVYTKTIDLKEDVNTVSPEEGIVIFHPVPGQLEKIHKWQTSYLKELKVIAQIV